MIRPLRGGRSGEFSRDDLSRNMNEEGKARGEVEEWPSCKLNVLTSPTEEEIFESEARVFTGENSGNDECL